MELRPGIFSPLLAVTLALGACAADQESYPSLSVRQGERVSGTFAPVKPVAETAPPPPSAATLDQIGQLRADASAANQRFVAAAQAARGPVAAARGAEPGSEEWSVAEVALADAEGRRSETMKALAELDRIHVAAELDGSALSEIEAAVSEVSALVDAENRQLDELAGGLGQ